MAENQDLEALSSKELHDRAVKHALHHGGVKFLWQLAEQIPAAEAVAGVPGEGEADMINVVALLNDYIHSGEGNVADALRPMYIDYLTAHPGA